MPRNPATHVGAVVKIDGAEIPCDPASLAPGVLSGLKVTWGRDDRLSMPAASTCDLQLVDTDGGPDYTGTVRFNSTVEVLAVSPTGTRSRVFAGHVTDLKVVHEDGADAIVSATAIDPTARLSGVMVGTHPWPQQTTQARRSAILASVPSGTVHWPALPPEATTGALPQARLDVDNQTLWDVMTTFLWGIAVVPWPIAYGANFQPGIVQTVGRPDQRKPAFDTRDNRRMPYAQFLGPVVYEHQVEVPTVVLDACDVDLEGTEFTSNPNDVKQRIRVAWGGSQDEAEGGTGTFERDYSNTIDPARTFDVTSGATSAAYAQNVATYWSFHMSEWYQSFSAPWGVGGLRLDPDTVTGMDDFDVAMVRLLEQSTRIDHAVMLQGLPAWAPWRDKGNAAPEPHVFAFLQGGTYTYEDGRWVLDLALSAETALVGDLAPPLVVVVRPGDVVPFAHDAGTVDFQPQPDGPWPPGVTAIFADGDYGWDGEAWVAGGTRAIIVTPGSVQTVPHGDARVRPDPSTPWGLTDYATFTDGQYTWTANGWAVYVAPVYVSPGATVDVPHDASNVYPRPSTPWGALEYATFSDGTWRWDGAAWVAVTLVRPGDTTTLAHDDPAVVPSPTTPWAADEFATFTDGDWRWDGEAWALLVAPGDTVDAAHDDPRVQPNPTTAWGTNDYATFTDGDWRWDGEAWVESATVVVHPYDTVTVAHDDPRVVPEPATHWWVSGTGSTVMAPAWFSDDTWSWQRTYWQRVYVIEPGDTSNQRSTIPSTTPWPTTPWAADEHATLADGTFTWSGTAWVPWVPTWQAAPEGLAWSDVPAGTAWNEWTGDI